MEPSLNFRKLAAIDIVFLSFTLALAEYAFGILFSIALGIFVMLRAHSIWQVALGGYFICLGINYIPMLAYTISLANKERAQTELGEELKQERRAMAKYRRLSLLLLVPLSVPALSIVRRLLRRRDLRRA